MRTALHQGCDSPPAPSLPTHHDVGPHCEKYHPFLSHTLKAEARFRIHTEVVSGFRCVCRIVPETVGSTLDHESGESEQLHPTHFRDGG